MRGLLIETPPGGLEHYRPRMAYLLIEENQYTEKQLAPLRNLVAALFRLENSRTVDDVRRVVEALVEWMQAPEQRDLRRAFTVWMKRVLLPARLPGVAVPEVQELQEVRTMLAERVVEWTQEWLEEGRQKGLEEGRRVGEAALLTRQLEWKFGPLSEEQRQRIAEADPSSLLLWERRVLTAQRLDQVFDEPGPH